MIGFVLSKTLETLLRPSALLLICALAGLLLLRLKRSRIGIALLALPLVFLAVLAVLPLDSWLLAPLEDRYPPLRAPVGPVTGIICLGGAVDTEITARRGIPSLNDAAERMTEFVSLARLHPEARLAFTGGSGRVMRTGETEAKVARSLFEALGLGRRDVVYEDRSRTTRDNAVMLAAMLHPRAGERWVLVTSAAHMPRAMGAFHAAGWPVVADPVGFKTAPSWAAELHPTWPDRLSRIDAAAHEWMGLQVYRSRGWLAG